jgi:ribosome recycling factor
MVEDLKVNELIKDTSRRMEGAVEILHQEYGGLRTGRASTSLLDPIIIEAYGVATPLNQVGTVSVPEPRMLSIQVWDKTLVSSVEKAILDSSLGLNPSSDGQLVRIPIPALTEERRKELAKVAAKYAEESKISIRNVRRHAMDNLKNFEKGGNISQDELRDFSEEVQKKTDTFVSKIDELLKNKEQEILRV